MFIVIFQTLCHHKVSLILFGLYLNPNYMYLVFGYLLSLVASSNNLEVHMFLVSRFHINHVMKLFHSSLIVLLYY